ncbi:hypothetical protein E1285_44540 [Actinomadura sp. 7K507]|nr:hypothetical protein E1285_44540 [Actinomadura sp. 7K507]
MLRGLHPVGGGLGAQPVDVGLPVVPGNLVRVPLGRGSPRPAGSRRPAHPSAGAARRRAPPRRRRVQCTAAFDVGLGVLGVGALVMGGRLLGEALGVPFGRLREDRLDAQPFGGAAVPAASARGFTS